MYSHVEQQSIRYPRPSLHKLTCSGVDRRPVAAHRRRRRNDPKGVAGGAANRGVCRRFVGSGGKRQVDQRGRVALQHKRLLHLTQVEMLQTYSYSNIYIEFDRT